MRYSAPEERLLFQACDLSEYCRWLSSIQLGFSACHHFSVCQAVCPKFVFDPDRTARREPLEVPSLLTQSVHESFFQFQWIKINTSSKPEALNDCFIISFWLVIIIDVILSGFFFFLFLSLFLSVQHSDLLYWIQPF